DAWLAIPAKRGKVAHREFPMPREVRLALPTDPGVYRLQRSNGDVLYVGKARSLRKRVNSHFQKQSGIAEYRLELLSQAKRVDVTICETPLEAALLEADEIKRLAPPYNKALLEGERRAVFANRDFSEVRDRPSRSFAVGPITSRFAVGPIRLLVAALAGEPLEGEARSWVLGVGPDRAPPDPLFDAGLVAFRQRWGDQLITPDGGLSPDALYRTGAALMDCDLTVPDRVGEGPEWTEETVVRSLAMVVDTAARLARRGRWLCQLRECSVAWTARDAATRRCLVITGGAIARSFEMELAAELPIPPGHATSIPDRRRGFDVWSYDRLRVLMTELRRVAGDDPDAAVRFGPGRPLWGVRLQRALAWI
ncbi:MAG: DNA polymerase-3 subunit epsilon, partial [Myxococcota bacterium]